MSDLANFVRSASSGSDVQFRKKAYGNKGVRQFLRDVIALANAEIDGIRYIVIGVDFDSKGEKRLRSVKPGDFLGTPPYQSLVNDFIEPAIHLRYRAVTIDGKKVGVFEISDCRDQPYMMRADHSEKLRRGEAYIRVDGSAHKMGLRQLQDLFEKKLRSSAQTGNIEIGFPGKTIHKGLRVATTELDQMPSAIASAKIKKLLDVKTHSKDTGATTGIIRLLHARFFGSDNPYTTWTPTKLMDELAQVETKCRKDDLHFLFETNARALQLVIHNQRDEPIDNASLSIAMPYHRAFYVASELPEILRDGKYVDSEPDEQAKYPSVKRKNDAIHVLTMLGHIPAGSLVNAFEIPLRICVGSDLKGRKLSIRYRLFGRNLRSLTKGKLRLLF